MRSDFIREGRVLAGLLLVGSMALPDAPAVHAATAAATGARPAVTPDPGPGTWFVSPRGKDGWSGRLPAPNRRRTDGPFATIGRARDAVRAHKAREAGSPRSGSPLPLTVCTRAGTYFLTEPLVFTAEDSGTAAAPVTYRAYGDGPVVISGGRRITGWEPVNVAGRRLWAAAVPEARDGRWFFRQLWVNGQRRVRARHPNKGYLRVAEVPDATGEAPWDQGQTRFRFASGDLKSWDDRDAGDVVVMSGWVESHLPITRVDEGDRLVAFGKRSVFRLDAGDLYYVEHVFEALDAPGEWYLDRRSGTLYYRPMPGERMRRATVVAPVLTQLVRWEGQPESAPAHPRGRYVENLVFEGLTFAHAEWWFPTRAAPDPSQLDVGGFPQAAVDVPGALYGEGVRNLRLTECTVAHVGTYGIELGRGCQHNRVERCILFDLGAGGIKIGESRVPETAAEQSHSNTVADCQIHDGGRIFHSGIGVWVGQSYGNRLLRNHVHDFYYSGFSIGWTWGYGPSLARENRIEGNHVHHIGVLADGDGPILSDMGGIYTLGVQPGTVIRGNRFHDIAGLRYGGWGIYLDEGSTEILVEGNLVYRTTHGGFHQHYGRENVIRNNVFALGRDAQIRRSALESHRSFTFERNIVYWSEGNLLEGDLSDTRALFDRNLYWRVGGETPRFGDLTWEAWRGKGMDAGSRVADPLFVAPEKGDFRLKPGSPATALGFVPLEVPAPNGGPGARAKL